MRGGSRLHCDTGPMQYLRLYTGERHPSGAAHQARECFLIPEQESDSILKPNE
jgi:hypothetical protein